MSRNDLTAILRIGVRGKYKYYVIQNVCADTPMAFETYKTYLKSLVTTTQRYTQDWGKALVIAHRLDRRACTEYGVQVHRLNVFRPS